MFLESIRTLFLQLWSKCSLVTFMTFWNNLMATLHYWGFLSWLHGLKICTYFTEMLDCWSRLYSRLWFGPGTFLRRHDDQLPSLSGVHGLKDFLCSAHLLESFDGRIYTYWSVLKSKFVHQRTQEDEHHRENSSNHELLTVRGVDRHALLKMFWGQITV